MLRQFLVHRLAAPPFLVLEITGVEKEPEFLPNWKFHSWKETEAFFINVGATNDELSQAKSALDSSGFAHLIIKNAANPN